MSQEIQSNIPKVRIISEVGEAPFQVLGVLEVILQGWSPNQRRSVYLFKNQENLWSYYDKVSNKIIVADQWQGTKALIEDEWITMTKYHRLHVNFLDPVTFSIWVGKRKQSQTANEVQLNVTDAAFKTLAEAMSGRPSNSAYKFVFKTQKKPGGGSMTFVERIIWAMELPSLAA